MFNRLKNLLSAGAEKSTPVAGAPEVAVLVNAYCTRGDVPAPQFPHTLQGRRNLSDPELKRHLDGFLGYISSRGTGEMTRSRYHALRHVERVQEHWSFLAGQDQFDAVCDWAARANALLFLPDGHVRDDHGRILVSASDGSAEEGAEVPYPAEAWQRKQRHEAVLKEQGVHVAVTLPPLISEPELRLREPADVARRSLGVLIAAARAESVGSGEPMGAAQLQARLPAGFAALTPEEHSFVMQEEPSQADLAKFSWRYECLFVFAWALGLVAALPAPAEVCDVGHLVGIFLEADPERLIKKARLRTASEILDALDLHYRLHWFVTEVRLGRLEALPAVDAGIVLERHRALNWLVRFEDAEWDEVSTPT